MTVRPLVVARCVDQRVDEAVELGPDGGEVGVATDRGTVLDVPEVIDELDAGVGVDLIDNAREPGDLRGAVGDVADDREAEAGLARRLGG
ncbi:MAG: hypothetical protein JWR58_6679, partial [Pseudonocardia sp.]|nr:hypothetical protein [Pseudonocardia sp.]